MSVILRLQSRQEINLFIMSKLSLDFIDYRKRINQFDR